MGQLPTKWKFLNDCRARFSSVSVHLYYCPSVYLEHSTIPKDISYLHSGVIRCHAVPRQSIRHRQMFEHGDSGIGKSLEETVRRIETCGAGADNGHIDWP